MGIMVPLMEDRVLQTLVVRHITTSRGRLDLPQDIVCNAVFR